jgi:EAL domain-containing protein (putative c-di-GMP-specific phosphodiesterase class I)
MTERVREAPGVADESGVVEELLAERQYRLVYQPVVELATGRVFGNEALVRSLSPRLKGPMDVIQAAVRAGRMGELGRAMRELAVRGCPDTVLLLNIVPQEFDEGYLVQPNDPIFRHRRPVFLEITESTPLDYFDQCHFILDELRKRGALLAIDDFGAGYSNFKYIADLQPEVIKLDRKLIAAIKPFSRQYGLLRAVVHLAHQMGAKVVAEGIETADELNLARDGGADYAQGYFLAYPAAPPPTVPWPLS